MRELYFLWKRGRKKVIFTYRLFGGFFPFLLSLFKEKVLDCSSGKGKLSKCQAKHQSGEKVDNGQGLKAVTKAAESLAWDGMEPRWPHPTGSPSTPGTQNVELLPLLQEPAAGSLLFLSFWQNQVLRHLGRKLFMCQYFRGILLCEGEKEARGEANIKTNLSRDGFFFFLRLKSVYCSSHPFSPSSFMMLLRCPFQHNIFKWSKPWGSSWCLAVMKYI